MSFSERLNEAMKNAGISQADLHRRTGYSRTAISKWCNGQTEPKDMLTLASILRVTPEWLQFGKESRVPANLVSLHGGGLPVPNSAPNDLVAQDSDEEMMLRFLRMMTDEQRQETLNSAKKVYDHNQEIMEKLSSRKRA